MIATDTAERLSQAPPTHDAELVPVASTQQRALAPPQSWQAKLQGSPDLATALVAAIQACQAVPHDARVAFPGTNYAYTSSEAIIAEARKALASNGLAVIPVEQVVNGSERTGPDRFELVQKRLLLHISGQSILCVSAWPIIPNGDKRPLDKATAAADTLSLSYFLRDLLQMPRVDPADDINQRRDGQREERQPQQPQQKPAKKATAPKPQPAPEDAERITEAERAELTQLLVDSQANVAAFLAYYHVPVLAKLPRCHLADARGRLKRKQAERSAGTPPAGSSGVTPTQPSAPTGPAAAPGAPAQQAGGDARPTSPSASATATAAAATPTALAAAQTGPSSSPPTDEPYESLLRRIHGALQRSERTWLAGLQFVGVEVGEQFEEPTSLEDVDALAGWLPRKAAEKLLTATQKPARGKKAPAGGSKS